MFVLCSLIGLAAGTILGALVGNAIDQDYQAARDATLYGKPVIYYDKSEITSNSCFLV